MKCLAVQIPSRLDQENASYREHKGALRNIYVAASVFPGLPNQHDEVVEFAVRVEIYRSNGPLLRRLYLTIIIVNCQQPKKPINQLFQIILMRSVEWP